MKTRTWGVVLIVVGVVGLALTSIGWAAGGPGTGTGPGWMMGPGGWGPFGGTRGGPTCTTHALRGQTVDVVLSDMGGMMGGGMMGGGMMGGGMMGGGMMRVAASPTAVSSGDVSFTVWNAGMMVHEFVVLPLPAAGTGTRVVGSDGRVSEAGSLGEASKSCGEGAGDGIAPGAAGWVTLRLGPGRYELICNLPGHYAMGMYTELDVR